MNQKRSTPAAPKRGLLQRLFGFDPQTMTLKKEIIGGITTFFTMAYILAVNPAILSETGMDSGALFTSTALAAIIATLIMSLYAKLPFVLAPGMGLNAFFAYTIVLLMGYTWQFALTAVFLEGLLFILFTVTGLRQKLVDTVPSVMHHAISAGIGLFLAFLGLKSGGVIVDNPATLITLGDLTDPGVLLTVIGLIVTSLLLVKNVSGAFLIGILLTALIGIALGVTTFKGIVSLPPSIAPIFLQFQWSDILSVDMFVCVITLLFTDMFDTIGTVIGVSQRAGMVDEKGNVKNMNKAFMSDAIGTTLGAVVGSSTVTTFVESASGITAGGRSGLTSFTAVLCFALALFFSPPLHHDSATGHRLRARARGPHDDRRHQPHRLHQLPDGRALLRVHDHDAVHQLHSQRHPPGLPHLRDHRHRMRQVERPRHHVLHHRPAVAREVRVPPVSRGGSGRQPGPPGNLHDAGQFTRHRMNDKASHSHILRNQRM